MHLHKWSKWEDVKISDKPKGGNLTFQIFREVITQQRRCSVCNLVKTRTS